MGDSFWTSYSDLFVGMSVIFLVLFFFATLRVGVMQLKMSANDKQHEETLKGAIPKEVADKTEKDRTQVKQTLDMIAQKRDELGKLNQKLGEEQVVFDDVLKDQERKTAQLNVAYATNMKLENQLRDINQLKIKLEEGLRQKDDAISTLGRKMQDAESAKAGLEATVTQLNETVKDKDATIETHRQRVDALTGDLAKRTIAYEEASNALESERAAHVRLDTQIDGLNQLKSRLEAGLKEKDDAISTLGQKIQDVENARTGLEKTVRDLDASLKEKDTQIGGDRSKIDALTVEVSQRRAALDEARGALAGEQAKSARLYDDLQKNSRDLERALSDANHARSEMDLLRQDVVTREGQISKLKGELGDAAQATAALRAEVSARDGKIRDLAELTDNLKGELAGRDRKIAGLNSDAADALRKIAGLKREVGDRDSKIAQLGADADGLRHEIGKRNGQIDGLKSDLADADSKAAADRAELGGRDRKIADLKGELDQAAAKLDSNDAGLGDRDREIGRLKGELAGANGKGAADRAELDGRDRKIADLKHELGGLQRQLDGRDGVLGKLKSQLADASNALDGTKGDLDRYKKLYNDVSGGGDAKDRKIASLDNDLKKAQAEINELSKLRKEIAGGVLNNLRAHGVDVAVDPESGILTLSMDEVFQFKNGSYEIADASKAKIRKIMPVYANSLFGNAEQAAKIAGVVITGHASPRYKKRFVDPKGYDRLAYIFNLDLSMKRAHQVAAFIFGDEIGGYPHKQQLKEKTSVAGKGYMDPVAKGDDPDRSEPCGPYDCPRSRRVEINFILKENKPKVPLASLQAAPIAPAPRAATVSRGSLSSENRIPAAVPIPVPGSSVYGPMPPAGWTGAGAGRQEETQ